MEFDAFRDADKNDAKDEVSERELRENCDLILSDGANEAERGDRTPELARSRYFIPSDADSFSNSLSCLQRLLIWLMRALRSSGSSFEKNSMLKAGESTMVIAQR